MISNVKQMFERGTIRTQSAAETLIKLIQKNKMDQVDAKMEKFGITANKNQPKDKLKKLLKNRTTQHRRETSMHHLKIKK